MNRSATAPSATPGVGPTPTITGPNLRANASTTPLTMARPEDPHCVAGRRQLFPLLHSLLCAFCAPALPFGPSFSGDSCGAHWAVKAYPGHPCPTGSSVAAASRTLLACPAAATAPSSKHAAPALARSSRRRPQAHPWVPR